MTDTLCIVFWSWKDPSPFWKGWDYGPAAVARLARQVSANLRIPHELVCISDKDPNLQPSVRWVPLWPDHRDMGRCWVRLKAFSGEMRKLIGPRFVWLDTDCVVTGDLTPLFDRPEPLVLWDGSVLPGQPVNGSMVLMDAGYADHVWRWFRGRESAEAARRAGFKGSDQAWIAHAMRGLPYATWTAADGVLHWGSSLSKAVPRGSRIVFFPGRHKPGHPYVSRISPWVAETLATRPD